MTSDPINFEDFLITGDERYISLCHNKCKTEVTEDIEWWGELPLLKLLTAVGEHECPKRAYLVEDSFMTNAEMEEIKDAAVATGRYQVRGKPFQFKGNPYAKVEENGGSLTMTVVPKNNVL